jgi:hypothetical protein
MRSSDNSNIKKNSHSSCDFENPIVFDYHIKNSLYPAPKEKEHVNEEGWKQFLALCLGLLFLPTLVFSAETRPHVAEESRQRASLA